MKKTKRQTKMDAELVAERVKLLLALTSILTGLTQRRKEDSGHFCRKSPAR
jgi:hypothetical protein